MSYSYFKIKNSEDFENVKKIIDADKEAKHFVRNRRYTPFNVSNKSIKSAFEKNIRHSESGYFKSLCQLSVIFLITLAVTIYCLVATTLGIWSGLIALLLTTLAIGIVWGMFLICFIKEHAFVKTCDDLFILYNSEGNPYSVEIRKNRVRVLFKDTLYIITGKRIKKTQKPRKLYYAYLNMFPQAVLEMEKYIDKADRDNSEILFTPVIEYLPDGCCDLSIGERGKLQIKSSSNDKDYKSLPLLRSMLRNLHFYKYIFTLNDDLKLVSVHSAVRENAIISQHILTFATVTESGVIATESLKKIADLNSQLKKVLCQIDNSF